MTRAGEGGAAPAKPSEEFLAGMEAAARLLDGMHFHVPVSEGVKPNAERDLVWVVTFACAKLIRDEIERLR